MDRADPSRRSTTVKTIGIWNQSILLTFKFGERAPLQGSSS